MVEELPVGTSSEELLDAAPITEESVAAAGISAVLLRAKRQADALVERARSQDGDLNGEMVAGQATVSLSKDKL